KDIASRGGGMVVGDPEFVERARVVSLHGMSRDAWRRYEKGESWHYEVVLPGFKYNMTDIQAALGIAQLAKLEGFQTRRREVARRYTEAFADEPALQVPVCRAGGEHAWHLYVLRLHPAALSLGRDGCTEGPAARHIRAPR